jgi:hypothetical protein
LTAFSDLRSGYQPLSNQSPPSTSHSSSVTSVPPASSAMAAVAARPLPSVGTHASRYLDMSHTTATVPGTRPTPRERYHLQVQGMLSRMRQMYQYWSAAVVTDDPEEMELGITTTSLIPLSQGRKLLTRILLC